MTNKNASVIATILTVVALIVLAVVSILFEMLALNGASESQGTMAMGISLACQSISMILIGIFTWHFTSLLISKMNWNKALAVIAAMALAVVLGGIVSFLSLIISNPIAGIK